MTIFHNRQLRHTGRLLTAGTLLVFMAVQLFTGAASQASAATRQGGTSLGAADPAVPNYSPTSRTVGPVAVYATSGTVTNPNNVLSGSSTRISGTNSYIVLDFGKEVGGIVTLRFAAASNGSQQVGLA